MTNPLALKVAGRHGSLTDLEHVGRVSGTTRHTPVRAFRSGGQVVVGANFGRESDWVKNVVAAGGARMRIQGQTLVLTAPRLLSLRDAGALLPPWFRIGLRYFVRTRHCVVFDVDHPRTPW